MERFTDIFQKLVIITLSIFFIFSSHSFAEQVWDEDGTDLVARITVIEGRLERFDPETQEWIVTVPDAPLGIGDQIFAGTDTRVEILIPNNTIMRIGEETEARFISLTEKLTEIDLFSGTARLYNNSSQTDIIATTQFGHIEVPPGASVDLNIDDKAVEIISLVDSVYFTGNQSSVRHEIIAGRASLLALSDRVMPADGSANRSWNAWNNDRDVLWAERRRISGEVQDYLPVSLHDEAYILNTCGAWHRVYYEGAYYRFWRPRYVDIGWSPFSVGMWMSWRGDRVWIPREPFGYVTHHYGNWIYTQGTWYWAPPVSRVVVRSGFPLLNIGFCWYPGRVAWIDFGIHASWIPLAPFEPFYSRYPWGFRTIVIGNGPYPRYVTTHKFKYRRYTVNGRQDHFCRDEKGSHVSKWRGTSRSGIHSPQDPRNKDRFGTRSFRAAGEKRNENHIYEDRKREELTNQGQRKHAETGLTKDHKGEVVGQMRNQKTKGSRSQQTADITQRSGFQNRSGVTRTDKNAVRTDTSDRRIGQNKNRSGAEKRGGNRESIVVTNDSAVTTLPGKSRQFNSEPMERSSSQVKNQNRFQSSAENIQQPGFQNRSGSVRTGRSTLRTGDRTYRKR